jgi:Zn ribbon nucleic-acid-binding protein
MHSGVLTIVNLPHTHTFFFLSLSLFLQPVPETKYHATTAPHLCDWPDLEPCPFCERPLTPRRTHLRSRRCPDRLRVECSYCAATVADTDEIEHVETVCDGVHRAEEPAAPTAASAAVAVNRPCLHCGARFDTAAGLQAHEHGCGDLATACAACGEAATLGTFAEHEAEQCPVRPVRCPTCDATLPLAAMEDHVPLCPLAEVECVACGEAMLSRDRPLHLSSGECRGIRAPCPHCGESRAPADLALHMLTCPMLPQDQHAVTKPCGDCGVCEDCRRERGCVCNFFFFFSFFFLIFLIF